MSWEPKRETTLTRLMRQARAIEKQIATHNKAVERETGRLHNVIMRTCTARKDAQAKQDRLEALQEEIEDLAVRPDEG